MFKPDDAEKVDSVKSRVHDIKIEPNGQIVFNKAFHHSKIINEKSDTVFLIQSNTDRTKIYFSFANVEELQDDEDYQSASDDDKAKAEKNRNKLGYYTLESKSTGSSGLQKGVSVALKKCTDVTLFKEGFRGSFTEGDGLEVDEDNRFVTAIIDKHKFVAKKKTVKEKVEEKTETLKASFIKSFVENIRVYDGEGNVELQHQLRTNKKYKDLDVKLTIKEAKEVAEDLGIV